MASNFAKQENSDWDSSWIDFTGEVLNSSESDDKVSFCKSFPEPFNAAVETVDVKNLHKLDDGIEMKKSSSSEEFEVIDDISNKSSDDDSDSSLKEADEAESIYSEGALSSDELEVLVDVETISDKGETLLPYFSTTQNLEQNFKEKGEKLGAEYKPISKYLFGSKNEETKSERLGNKTSNKSVIYSDDEGWKAPTPPHFNDAMFRNLYVNLLTKNSLRRYRAKKSQQMRSIIFFTIGIAFSVTMYELIQIGNAMTPKFKDSPKETPISTPVKDLHPGWETLMEEFRPILNMLDDRSDSGKEEVCPVHNVNAKGMMKEIQGISFTMLKNDMMISIGVDEWKTFVIYEKNGVIDVKMMPEKLSNGTKLLFTLHEEMDLNMIMMECYPLYKFIKMIEKVVDTILITMLLFIKIMLGIAIAFLRVVFWSIDFYMKHVWKVFGWR